MDVIKDITPETRELVDALLCKAFKKYILIGVNEFESGQLIFPFVSNGVSTIDFLGMLEQCKWQCLYVNSMDKDKK